MTNDFVYTDEMYKEDKKISYFVLKNKLHLSEELKQEYKNDLIQISIIQLYRARQTFDEAKGVKYISYAVKASLRKMLQYLQREDHKGKINNKVSLSKEITEDLSLEDTLGNYDIYTQLERDRLKALKEFIKAIITKPRKYKKTKWKYQLKRRKTGLRKYQKIALEHFVDGKTRQDLQTKYNVSRQCIEQMIKKYKTILQKELLKSELLI